MPKQILLPTTQIQSAFPRPKAEHLRKKLSTFDSREDLSALTPVTPQPGWRLRQEDFGGLAFEAVSGSLMRLDGEEAVQAFITEHNVKQLVTGKGILNSLRAPVKLFFDITKICNLTCEHCLSSSGRSTETLPAGLIKAVLRQAYDLGVFQVKFGGGEPLLHPRFFDLVNLANSLRMRVSISTNGTVLTNRRAALIKTTGVRVSVSIDGNEDVHDQIRSRGSYKGALRGIERLLAHGVRPTIRMTLFNSPQVSNLHLVEDVVALGQRYKLGVKLRRAKPAGRATVGGLPLAFPTEAYWALLDWLDTARKRGADIDIEDLMCLSGNGADKIFPTTFDCAAGTRSIHVDVYGDVSPCVFLGPSYTSGNVFESSLDRVWYEGAGFKSARDYTTEANADCGSCERNKLCSGECRAAVFYVQSIAGRSADGGEKDPCCPKEQRIYEFTHVGDDKWRPVRAGRRDSAGLPR